MHDTHYAGLGLDGFLFAVLWFVALTFFLYQTKVFAASACTLGILGTIFGASWPHTQSLALLVLAAAIWLEAIGRDRIYARLFATKTAKGP